VKATLSRLFISLTLIGVLWVQAVAPVFAVAQGVIRIDIIQTVENQDAMNLKLYFNLFDSSSGEPITRPRPQSAQVTLVGTGYTSPASISPPDLPIYLTLLLDASGSMAGNAQKLRDAAKIALTNPPENAYFGVVQFNEEISLLQDFTQNLTLVNYAIDQYATINKGTCLYDSAYLSVEAQADAPYGRRGVILFTDGKDETTGGQPCSKHTYQELVDKAVELGVPIHTVGLRSTAGNINEVELRNIAGFTGGYSIVAEVNDLPQAFSQIMESLKTQMMAEATIFPRKDQNEAVFTITFDDDTTLNTAFFINSETDYPGPASPVQMRFDGLQLLAETQDYDLQMTITSPELVGYVKVAIWDTDSGAKVTDLNFDDPEGFNRFTIPTDLLTANRKYELRMSAISREANTAFVLSTSPREGQTTELVHEFTYDPSGILPTLTINSVTQDGTSFVLNVALTNPQQVGGFDGWLVNKATNIQVKDSQFNLPADAAAGGRLELSTTESRLASGKYAIVLRLLDTNNQVLSVAQVDEVTYQQPGLLTRLNVALIAMPVFIAIIAGVVLFVVVFLVISSSRQKNLSSTPVMSGQLGKKGKKNQLPDGLQAIANDEPFLPSTKASPSPSPVKASTPRPAQQADQTVLYDRQAPAPEPVTRTSQSLPPQLTVVKGLQPQQWVIQQMPYVIGRTEGNLVINVNSVSRKHAQITSDGRQNYFITDLNSSNGTQVNGKRLPAGQAVPLANGAMIEIGRDIVLRFERR